MTWRGLILESHTFSSFSLMVVENPVVEKIVDNVKKPNAPRSVNEVAEQAVEQVDALKYSFNEQFHEVMRKLDEIALYSKGMNDVAGAMKQIRDKLFEIGISLGKTEESAQIEREEAALEDGVDLFNKFSQFRGFLRTSADNLKKTAASMKDAERTDFETRTRITEGLRATTPGMYLLEHFEDDLHALLDESYNPAAHDAFKAKVLQTFKNDESVSATDKVFGELMMSSLINSLRLVENLKGNSHLSAASIDGMIGHVPSEEDMQRLFDRDFEYIQSLPAGSIRLKFMGNVIDFYHEESEPVPSDIAQKIKDDKLPVIDVHYRTDADVAILLADMSKGEFLRGKMCNGGDCVEIEGQTKSPDVDLHQAPAGLDKKEFLARPMKYLSHDIVFSTSRIIAVDQNQDDKDDEK